MSLDFDPAAGRSSQLSGGSSIRQSGTVGAGISILSYAGELRIGISADAGLVPDPRALVRAFVEEVETLGAGTTE